MDGTKGRKQRAKASSNQMKDTRRERNQGRKNEKLVHMKDNGWLGVFYDISNLVGYVMPNPVYKYINFINE